MAPSSHHLVPISLGREGSGCLVPISATSPGWLYVLSIASNSQEQPRLAAQGAGAHLLSMHCHGWADETRGGAAIGKPLSVHVLGVPFTAGVLRSKLLCPASAEPEQHYYLYLHAWVQYIVVGTQGTVEPTMRFCTTRENSPAGLGAFFKPSSPIPPVHTGIS